VVDERLEVRRTVDWFSPIAENAIKAYLADPKAEPDAVKKLGAVWTTRNDIVKLTADRAKLAKESDTLSQSTEETRRNLRAIEKNKTAEALRQKLTARLAEAATKLDDYNRKLVELDAKLGELNVTFKEGIRDVKVLVAPPPR
jgi:DNA repair exonuclease SbcCD ATPase subunit